MTDSDTPLNSRTNNFFVFNKVVIIKSLEPEEFDSASALRDYVHSQLLEHNLAIDVEILDCESAREFAEIVDQLTKRALSSDERPILHIECHGAPATGLEFANGSELSWPEVSLCLTRLNQATDFNLFVSFAACFGFHFLGQLSPITSAPCWGMVGPTEKVDPGEILRGFRTFYRTLFSTIDLSKALDSMSAEKLESSSWFAQIAEMWFLRICYDYIRDHCSLDKTRERARQLKAVVRMTGQRARLKDMENQIRFRNTHDLLGKYFESYFMIGQIPSNKKRFQNTHQTLEDMIRKMHSTKEYGLSTYSLAKTRWS